MPLFVSAIVKVAQSRLRARRRAANLRAGQTARRVPAQTGWSLSRCWTMSWNADWNKHRPLVGLFTAILLGAVLIAGHARYLAGSSAMTPEASAIRRTLEEFQPVLPGVQFEVPQRTGASISLHPQGALLVLAGMQAAAPVRIDLCSQLRAPDDARLLPLRLGYRFEDVARLVAQSASAPLPLALRNVLLVTAQGDAAGMPLVQISGRAERNFEDAAAEPLQLSWKSERDDVRWLSDASLGQVEQGAQATVRLRQQGWLMWGEQAALHIQRRSNITCPQAGELRVQLYRPARQPLAALVQVFPARGQPLSSQLAPGQYQVPGLPPAELEDARLFADLQAQGLLRLNGQGSIELAPADLLQWQALAPTQRVAGVQPWQNVAHDERTRKLLKRLYYQADGAYLRQQVALFNNERWLLAWRLPLAPAAPPVSFAPSAPSAPSTATATAPALLAGRGQQTSLAADQWQAIALADGADAAPMLPLATSAQMPLAASRLFATLPQGWQSWQRLAQWPADTPGLARKVQLQLALPRAAQGGEQLRLMLIGQVGQVDGASLQSVPACTGRACPDSHAVQQLTLSLQPGARAVRLQVTALPFQPVQERKYRHLWLERGQLSWQALPRAGNAAVATGAAGAAAAVDSVGAAVAVKTGAAARHAAGLQLTDRHGTLLWHDGQSSAAALQAGLGPMLGLARDHSASVAGMLGRLAFAPQHARLTLDLPLQTLAQQVLECVGMRRGQWLAQSEPVQQGERGASKSASTGLCRAGQTVPEARHAGLVILDGENGDILAAAGVGAGAGAGTAVVRGANWNEVRDFDRTNPARSPLRLPVWQHDGGAHNSPGSTFKVITALGLELAARQDAQLDALLSGLPLPALNRLAQQRGFGFQTDAASYPRSPHLAHITNFREQSLDRRAQDGKLGMAQALTYSLNTWFAWTGELSDRSLFGRAEGGAPDLQALDPDALDSVRPIVAAAHRLGFEHSWRLDGGLLPADFDWRPWDALQATPAHIDPVHTRHELRQMSIGLRMQATPLQMALASAAIAQGHVVTPRLLLALDQQASTVARADPLGIRLDRIRAGMKGVVDVGTGAGAFRAPALATLRAGLYGKTGTAPSGPDSATVWFTGWLEAGSLPGQHHRLAMAVYISHSEATGGEHAAPVLATLLAQLAQQKPVQKLE